MINFRTIIERQGMAARKAIWRISNNYSPNARPIFILGAQRSGTTLLIECMHKSMEFEVFGETSKAMSKYRIRNLDEVKRLIETSYHRHVVFKPLTDSHRARDFLSIKKDAGIIWAFRRVEDRVNSSVAKFGTHNLDILRELSDGRGLDRWQALGLTDEDLKFIRSFDYSDMPPHSASAIFWYLRNSLFFSQELEGHDRVLPLAYEDLASDPENVMRGICKFVGAEFRQSMVDDVHAKSIGRGRSAIPDDLVELCEPVYRRLYRLQEAQWQAHQLSS